MSEPATEIAYVPLVAGTDLTAGEGKDIWEETLKTIASQPGFKSLYWGRQVEHPDVAQMVIDWDSIQSHKDFMAKPVYGPFLERLKPILASAPTIFHLKLPSQTPFSGPGSAPVTECISLYFEADHSTADYDANWTKFLEESGNIPNEIQGIIGGWGIEEQKHEKLGREGEEGPAKYFGAFIGWPSIEAHMEFRKHEKFPDVIQHLRNGPKAIAVHHVPFQKL